MLRLRQADRVRMGKEVAFRTFLILALVLVPIVFGQGGDALAQSNSWTRNQMFMQQQRQQQMLREQQRQQQILQQQRNQQQQLQQQRAREQAQRAAREAQDRARQQAQAAARRAQDAARLQAQEATRRAQQQAAQQARLRTQANATQRATEAKRKEQEALAQRRQSETLRKQQEKNQKTRTRTTLTALALSRAQLNSSLARLRNNPATPSAVRPAQRTQKKPPVKQPARPSLAAIRKKNCSFHGDTLVLTDQGMVPIRDIRVGEHQVWAMDEFTGETGWKDVLSQYSNQYDETVYVSILDPDTGRTQTIISNRIHPFFGQTPPEDEAPMLVSHSADQQYAYDGGWIEAADLNSGTLLLADDGTWDEVVSVSVEARNLKAFNLTVSEFHTFYVTALTAGPAVWVHNDCFKKVNFNLNSLTKDQRTAVQESISHINNKTAPTGWTRTNWGMRFENDGRDNGQVLPKKDSNGRPISYNEYRVDGAAFGGSTGIRLVIGSDKRKYFTSDHYKTFKRYQ